MLDQEAFARVIASGQPPHTETITADQHPTDQHAKVTEDEEEQIEIDDVTYHSSGVTMENADPVWALRMACLPVLDILVRTFTPTRY
jgi:hypothetical protein